VIRFREADADNISPIFTNRKNLRLGIALDQPDWLVDYDLARFSLARKPGDKPDNASD
jgi:hypothetical protein